MTTLSPEALASMRREYGDRALLESAVSSCPLTQFLSWLDEAQSVELDDPTAMVLSTVNASGEPNARVLLLKGIEEGAFIFYTHTNSVKGEELSSHPVAALTFYWPKLARQVRVRGSVQRLSHARTEAYFVTRPRESQYAAMASHQSSPIENRTTLEEHYHRVQAACADQVTLCCPETWGGYGVIPFEIEFWQGRDHRLHDRLQYRQNTEGVWQILRLYP